MRSYAPDIAIVDIRLPPTHSDDGIRAAVEIRAAHPSVGVLVVSLGGHPFPFGTLAFGSLFVAALLVSRAPRERSVH